MDRTLWLSLLLVSSGCASLYEVRQGTTKLDGIPFYVQAGACTQETLYLETVYQIAVQIPGADKTPPTVLFEKAVPASVYNSDKMQELRDAVTKGSSTHEAVRKAFEALKPRYSPDASAEVTLASNSIKADKFVDYSEVHYVNVKRPWIGSTSGTAKLNEDGTLAETAAEVEDSTVETLLSAFPVGEVLMGALGAGGGVDAFMAIRGLDPSKGRPVQLVVTPSRFKHILTKTARADVPCAVKPKIELNDTTANWRREAIANDSGKGKEDENTIAVSGKVVLPKKGGSQ